MTWSVLEGSEFLISTTDGEKVIWVFSKDVVER